MKICEGKVNVKKKKAYPGISKMSVSTLVCILVFITSAMIVYASASNGSITNANQSFNNVVTFLAGWIGKLGLVVGFIGAIQFAFGIKNDDADGKTKGLRTLISGFVVFAVTLSLNLFGIT
jgi:hypothetical protein